MKTIEKSEIRRAVTISQTIEGYKPPKEKVCRIVRALKKRVHVKVSAKR
ncbi:hypothetical protein [Hydrogenimonas cancrithermarum]|uniref:50S ribosomal protein L22 n=1 Tax=Hydrogenimonas cancrithermarum TaxID=2993563 RepID=A0ABN6WXX3_9BACT|nr:hypothetical protein [Hydrogenimonas cancrithermarum]BDY12850.1 hypothetical protein HCR_11620 [Hydrogenimonas cancrithermarum]BDY12967.1 hypothetical protein HCR_12790 [Hydrogenimonas cancrithermarum]